MIWRRSPFCVRRWSALAGVLGVLSGGCVVAGGYWTPGEREGTPSAPRAVSTDAQSTRPLGAIPLAACSPAGLQLIEMVNAYRTERGLSAIPASPSLCTVAATHTRDLAEHAPHAAAGCNLHSWSARGNWTPCCYTEDHAQSACMWRKPGELTRYRGFGFENSAAGVSSPDEALQLWRMSPEHDAVILNRGTWTSYPWRAIGADVHGGFALLWFGKEPDPVQ